MPTKADEITKRIEDALDDFERYLSGPSFAQSEARQKRKRIMGFVHDLRREAEKKDDP